MLCAFKTFITDRTSQSAGAGMRTSIFNRCNDATVRTREVPLVHASYDVITLSSNAVASRNKWFSSGGTSGKLTLCSSRLLYSSASVIVWNVGVEHLIITSLNVRISMLNDSTFHKFSCHFSTYALFSPGHMGNTPWVFPLLRFNNMLQGIDVNMFKTPTTITLF